MTMKQFCEKLNRSLIVLLLALSISFNALPATISEAKAPAYNAKITRKNILKLLDEYDSDGAFIVRNTSSESALYWFHSGVILDSIGTCVHEQFHEMSYRNAFYGQNIYVGNKKSINVPYTNVFKSEKMEKNIPKRLQTFRFTYVTDAKLSSNLNGIYGLLNEFAAYNWGLNTMVNLYPYCAKNNAVDTFYIKGVNDKNAYAEFSYYMLHYLYYAKNNNKSVYNGIMKNESFRKAYKQIDKRFRKNIKTFDKITKDGSDYKWHTEDAYTPLMKEISKNKYHKIYRQLTK